MSYSLKTHLISASLTAIAAVFGYLSTALLSVSVTEFHLTSYSDIAMGLFTIGYRTFLKEFLTPQNESK